MLARYLDLMTAGVVMALEQVKTRLAAVRNSSFGPCVLQHRLQEALP